MVPLIRLVSTCLSFISPSISSLTDNRTVRNVVQIFFLSALIIDLPLGAELKQEIIKVREWIPHIGLLTRVIHLNLFLDMVPSSSANFSHAIFPRCAFSWRKQRRRVMADRASSKRKFEVSNAPSNKRQKTSPNLFCSKERTRTLCDRNKIKNLLLLDCTRSYAAIRSVLF